MSKFLITYATWTGATKEVAQFMAEKMRARSVLVDVISADSVTSLDHYDCVIAGSSIHASRTVKNFDKFLNKFKNEILEKPHAFFVVCANMNQETETTRNETLGWLNKTLEKIGQFSPISVGLFAGAVITDSQEFHSQNFLIKRIIMAMQVKMTEDFGKSDFRNWENISDWANELVSLVVNR